MACSSRDAESFRGSRFTDLDGDFISTLVHSVMVLYALTVAMIAITVWETYDTAALDRLGRSDVTCDAVSRRRAPILSQLGEQLQDALRGYTEYVIEEAWPEQHKGRIPRRRSRIESTDSRRH